MRNKLIHILFFSLMWGLLTGQSVHGQQVTSSFSFQHITTDAGLSHSTVHDLLEDHLGMIWIGTRFGLNRFDGYEFKVYLPDESDPYAIKGHTVYCLWEDASGNIWVGQKGAGISILERKTGRFIPFAFEGEESLDLETTSVRALFEDSRGYLWIGTYGSGVVVLDQSKNVIQHFCSYCGTSNYKLTNDFIFDFEEDLQGRVWIGTAGNGINFYDPEADSCFSLFTEEAEAESGFGKSLVRDKQGQLWVGTAGNGLYSINLSTLQITSSFNQNKATKGLSHNMITDLEVDSLGQIWIATDGGGLNRFSPSQGDWSQFRYHPAYPNSLNTDALYDLMLDERGNMWIGTFNGGINLHQAYQTSFETNRKYAEERAQGLRSVLCLDQDINGNLWLGTDGGGLMELSVKASSIQFLPLSPALQENLQEQVITSLISTPEGNLWLGTFAQGLRYVNVQNGEVRSFYFQPNDSSCLSHNNVWDLELTSEGGLWVGTLGGGLSYLGPKQNTFKQYLPEPQNDHSISDVQIFDLLLDKEEENLWIATENSGLNRIALNTHQITQYHHNPADSQSLSSELLRCLFEDHEGQIWIGTEHSGLNVFSPQTGTFEHFSTKNGLPSNMIISIVQGPNLDLWISTQAGIVRWNRQSKQFIDIGSEPYLNNNQYNTGAALQLQDGRLVFGSTNGYSILLPDLTQSNSQPPQIVFTDFSISGQSIPVGEFEGRTILTGDLNDSQTVVYLSYLDKGINFNFASNDYSLSGKSQYAYRLTHFDSKWRFTGPEQRFANFSALPGGKYELEVKAANRYGIWTKKPRTLTLIVSPPFWEKWWFILLCIFSGLLLFWAIMTLVLNRQKIRFRQQALQAEQEILRLKNENLEKDISSQRAKLSASLLQIAHKNKILNDLKEQLQTLKLLDKEKSAQNLRKVLREINLELKEENYWDQFQLLFNQTHTHFVERLQRLHPQLTNHEKRLCCFIRMQLSNREIASILNITVRGVEQAKYRIKKKLNLSKENSLRTYIETIES